MFSFINIFACGLYSIPNSVKYAHFVCVACMLIASARHHRSMAASLFVTTSCSAKVAGFSRDMPLCLQFVSHHNNVLFCFCDADHKVDLVE